MDRLHLTADLRGGDKARAERLFAALICAFAPASVQRQALRRGALGEVAA